MAACSQNLGPRFLHPATLPPRVLNPSASSEKDPGKTYDAQKSRNEKLTLWNKLVQYAGGDSIGLAGMYKQRLDGDTSAKNPFYNPDGAGVRNLDFQSGFWEFLNSVNLAFLTKAGELGKRFLGPDNYTAFINSPEQRQYQNMWGDYLFAAGNGTRLIGGFIFAELFKTPEIRHKERLAKLQKLLEDCQKFNPDLVPLLEEYADAYAKNRDRLVSYDEVYDKVYDEYTNICSDDNQEIRPPVYAYLGVRILKRALKTKARATVNNLNRDLIAPYQAAMQYRQHLRVSATMAAARAPLHLEFSPVQKIKMGAQILKSKIETLKTMPAALRARRAQRLQEPQNYLKSPDDLARWKGLGDRLAQVSSHREMIPVYLDKIKLGAFLMTASQNIEETLANGSSYQLKQKNIEKANKVVAPLVNTHLGPFFALPMMGWAHVAIILATISTVKSNLPKSLKLLNNPKQMHMLKEMLSNMGFYVGFGIQSSYALWLGAMALGTWMLSDGNVEFSHVYDQLLQAKSRLPAAFEYSALFFMVAPQVLSLELETRFLKNAMIESHSSEEKSKMSLKIATLTEQLHAAQDAQKSALNEEEKLFAAQKTKDLSEEIKRVKQAPFYRMAFHGIGTTGALASFTSALYMANTTFSPLATGLTALTAIFSVIQMLVKNKGQFDSVSTNGNGIIKLLLGLPLVLTIGPLKLLHAIMPAPIQKQIEKYIHQPFQKYVQFPLEKKAADLLGKLVNFLLPPTATPNVA